MYVKGGRIDFGDGGIWNRCEKVDARL